MRIEQVDDGTNFRKQKLLVTIGGRVWTVRELADLLGMRPSNLSERITRHGCKPEVVFSRIKTAEGYLVPDPNWQSNFPPDIPAGWGWR